MPTSKSMLAFTILSVAAADFAGAVIWIPRLRRGSSASPTDEDHQASSAEALAAPSDEAAPTVEPSSAIIPLGVTPAPLPTLVSRFLFGAVSAPPSTMVDRILFGAAPTPLSAIIGPLSILSRASLQVVNSMTAPTSMNSAFLLTSPPSSQEVAVWCKKICYFIFFSVVSQSGEMMHICMVVEFSFSITGITFSVYSYIRGSGPTSLMCPAGVIDAIASPALLHVVEEPHTVGPTFTASSDRQLAIISSSSTLISLSRASSAGLTSSDGSGNFNGFFTSDSAPSSLSSLSRATSGSSVEIQQEINFENSWLEFVKPTLRFIVIPRPPPPPPRPAKVDEVALRIQAWKDEMRRLIKRGRRSSSWWRKVGWKLLKDLEKRGPALY